MSRMSCETNLHGADGMGVDIGLAPSWKGTLYGTPLMATLVVEAAFCNELRKQCSHLVPFLFGETNLHGADGMGVDIGLAPSWKGDHGNPGEPGHRNIGRGSCRLQS